MAEMKVDVMAALTGNSMAELKVALTGESMAVQWDGHSVAW